MSDPTEAIRRQRLVEINVDPGSWEALEAKRTKVDTHARTARTGRWASWYVALLD